MSERQEFSFEYLRARERQIAYLLSAAGACIAFSMTLADREMPRMSSIWFLVGISCWSLSFVFGVLARNHSIKLLAKTVIVSDMLPSMSNGEKEHSLALKAADEYITSFDFTINRCRSLQFAFLLVGATAFVAAIITSSPSFEWLFEGNTT